MPTRTVTRAMAAGGRVFTTGAPVTGGNEFTTEETIPDDSVNLKLVHGVDQSALKGVFISSTQDVTLKTNDGASPDDTIAIKAGVGYLWSTGDPAALLITQDVTDFYVTNESGAAADLVIHTLQDATP